MSFDNLCKFLAEQHPAQFANWLLGTTSDQIEILKTELSIEPIRADSVTFLKTTDRILHLEFQTRWPSEPPMPFRMLDYWVRLYRQYQLPIVQVVIVLLPPSDEATIVPFFREGSTYHEFNVIKMWEQDAALFLKDPALLPFASLAQTTDPNTLLKQVSQKIAAITQPTDRRAISNYVQVLAGLKYDKDTIRKTFREGMMRESVIFQEIYQEGEQRGKEEKAREVAIKMLQANIDLEAIAQFTGLPIDELQKLQAQ